MIIWFLPVAISLSVVFSVHNRKRKQSSDQKLSVDPLFTLLLPLLLWYFSHPFIIAFFVWQDKSSKTAIHRSILFFTIHLMLFFLFCLLHKIANITGSFSELFNYWIRAGLFFNLTMAMIQLLPWPPSLMGCFLFGKRTLAGGYKTGFILTLLVLILIPPDAGFGRLLFPVYHFVINNLI